MELDESRQTVNDQGDKEDQRSNQTSSIRMGTTFEWRGPHPCLALKFNPIVTFGAMLLIWGFVATTCILAMTCGPGKPCTIEVGQELRIWKEWITDVWTWLYIGTQDVWAIFILGLYFSKYGNMTLGKPGEKPEFNNATYFTMLFAAGVGIGLFFFGVAEPVYHYTDKTNRYFGRYTDNLRAQDAMNLTFFHWGIHGWIVYVLVGLLLGFIAYRQDLPMTMRSCFHPLLGDVIWGFPGDLVDILSIVCTMFGVCTSLGLGVMQFNAGLHRISPSIAENLKNQIIITWSITLLATISVVSGVKLGIRRLSELCFCLGVFILLIVFFQDGTWYFLNILCQSVGYYFQNILQLSFHTDAFVGNAPDRQESTTWMDKWTMFYWGWWISWSPFVGMFIARISKGRTIKEFIHFTLTIPMTYTFLWFSVFGGAGLKMERDAQMLGLGSPDCSAANATAAYRTLNGRLIRRLSCRSANDMWFDVISQYGDTGGFMSILSLGGILLYFVTSSDSGSLIIDCLSANGDPEPPVIQRVFWALTEGACATALLVGGGKEALSSLQSVSICAGLFYTIILNFMCVALWRSLKEASGDLDPNGPKFQMGLLDPFLRFDWWKHDKNWRRMAIAILAPWWPMGVAAGKLYDSKTKWSGYMVVLAIPFYLWVLLLAMEPLISGISYIGWAVFCGFTIYGMGLRTDMRERFEIQGNMIEDFFAVLLLYPNAALQMQDQMEKKYGEAGSPGSGRSGSTGAESPK